MVSAYRSILNAHIGVVQASTSGWIILNRSGSIALAEGSLPSGGVRFHQTM